MAEPKKQSSPRKTGTRRSHLLLKLARRVNGTSPVKVRTTKRETGKALAKSVKVTATPAPKAEKATTKPAKKLAK